MPPRRWDVTFGVGDVDTVAARCTELRDGAVNGPVNAPWSRTAEIRHPHGATLLASQFVPGNSELET